jgi:hypothetical protein
MGKDVSGKHMVWAVAPGAAVSIGLGYSSRVEAEAEAEKLKLAGYKIMRIRPMTLPKPNR